MIRFTAFAKQYGTRTAVESLSLEIARGEAVALLGPNGSGKTTSLKAAAGLLRPTTGRVCLGHPGRPASDAAARALISFLPQRVAFPESLTGREVVEFYRELRGVASARTDEALRFASLNGSSNRPVGTYSGGMMQRLGLAVAMLPNAPALLLDEPTAALDPEGLTAFYALVEQRKRDGGTLLFTSHHLGDAERLADRVAILVTGRLAGVFSGRELAERLASRGVLRLRLDTCSEALLHELAPLDPNACWAAGELVVHGAPTVRPQVIDIVTKHGIEVRSLTSEEGRLDLFYRELVAAS